MKGVDGVFDTSLIYFTACNGTIVNDTEMGEVIQLQGDQRKDVKEFLVDKKEGLELDAKTIKVLCPCPSYKADSLTNVVSRFMASNCHQKRQSSPSGMGR